MSNLQRETEDILITLATVVHNQERYLPQFLEEAVSVLEKHYKYYEILVIDNGSDDATIARVQTKFAQYSNIRLLSLSRTCDEQIAFTAALDNSLGDYVVMLELNSDPPEVVPKLVEKAREGSDVVSAVPSKQQKTVAHQVLSKAYHLFSKVFSGEAQTLEWSNFVCFSRKTVNSIIQIKDRVRYLKYLRSEVGFTHSSIPYVPICRSGELGRVNLLKKALLALEVTFANSDRVIRTAGFVCLAMSLLNFMYMFYVIAIKLFLSHVTAGWTSTSLYLASAFTILFFILFLMCEHLSLIYKEARKGPLYYIANEWNTPMGFKALRDKNVKVERNYYNA